MWDLRLSLCHDNDDARVGGWSTHLSPRMNEGLRGQLPKYPGMVQKTKN
jgi:hypothetical protein